MCLNKIGLSGFTLKWRSKGFVYLNIKPYEIEHRFLLAILVLARVEKILFSLLNFTLVSLISLLKGHNKMHIYHTSMSCLVNAIEDNI